VCQPRAAAAAAAAHRCCCAATLLLLLPPLRDASRCCFHGCAPNSHLTIERPTKGRFANVSHNIARLASTIFLKLQESNFLLYATRFSIMRSLVKRLGMALRDTTVLLCHAAMMATPETPTGRSS
jgi:hypothetical protein